MNRDRIAARWMTVILCLAAVTIAFHTTPASASGAKKLFQYLFFLPSVIAALWFGWKGGLATSLVAAVCFAPLLHSRTEEQWSESLDLLIIGSVLGLLADREQRKTELLRETTAQLQVAYERLASNVERWKHAERLSAFGQLAAGLAHEIRTPLAAIDGAAGLLHSEKADDALRAEMTGILQKESKRLNRLLTDLLEFARPRKPEFRSASLLAVAEGVVRLLEPQARKQSSRLELLTDHPLPEVECDAEQIRQILLNLCLNALQATGTGGEVRVHLRQVDGAMEITVTDNGPGISPDVAANLFEPFQTTKPDGTGLGLAVARQIAEGHNGSLGLDRTATSGAAFRLVLPLHQSQ